MEFRTIVIVDLDDEVRRWQVEATVDMRAKQHLVAVARGGNGVTRGASPRADDDEAFVLHELEFSVIHDAGDPEAPHLLLLHRRRTRRHS